MAQRTWIVALACGLSAGLVSGCTLLHGPKDDTTLPDRSYKPPPDPPPDPPSPYHAWDEKRAAPENPEIKQAQYSPDGGPGASGPRVPAFPDNPTDPRGRSPQPLTPIFSPAVDAGNSAPEQPVERALHSFLAKKLPDAIDALKRYDKVDQDALLVLLPLVACFAESGLSQAKPQEVEKFLEGLEDLSCRLRPRAALTLPRVCFCNDVHGFGMIEPLPSNHVFQSSGEGRYGEPMMLYVEVGNTTSRPVGQLHETRLAGRLDILDAQGKRVWGKTFPATPNSSFTPRHDYFIIFYFGLPAQLRPGRYTVIAEVTDQTWYGSDETPPHRTARKTLTIEVAAGEGVRVSTRSAAVMTPAGGGGR
jgi:hypothetical protein